MSDGAYAAVSLFSGAMGLDVGLESTGRFRVVACLEKEPVFCETIRLNQNAGRTKDRNLRLYEGDIAAFTPERVMRDLGMKPGDLDLLLAGPPCQSFSTAGRRGTVRDPRGGLLWAFVRWVEAFKPKMFLLENVRGLVSAAIRHRPTKDRPEKGGPPLKPDERSGSVLRLLARDLYALRPSYRMDGFEVNAVNYGAPQLRERLLLIGNRFNAVADFPAPTHGHAPAGRAATASGLLPFATLGDAIKGVREDKPVLMDFSPRKKRYLSLIPPGGNWRCLPSHLARYSMGRAYLAKGGRSGWWRRLSYDLPCPTVVTMPNHAGTSLCHPEEVRALTLNECALVQGFPPYWDFAGKVQEQYVQVGNAVPVRLGEVAGLAIAEALDQLHSGGLRRLRRRTVPFSLNYVRSHVRTRKWFKAGETFVWSDGKDNAAAAHGPMKTERAQKVIPVAT